ncbi:hypothetical protein K227x_38380 [Rubripirellula lacrimiformis]|uniref:Uncharacterized protein n=2 Tax=Rubripirellula lacrimiformis TaxID=1930273 RepID=A0A517NEG0_9BACT|nr:hypothetical protein K227x_38380 [Rubripirellula lacrimiformis]
MATYTLAQTPKLSELLQQLPSKANSIGYVHVPTLIQLSGDSTIVGAMSDNVDEVWFASDLNIGNLKPKWEAGYTISRNQATANTIAKAVDGYVDTVAARDVVFAPSQTYLVPMENNRVGFLRPADRSLLASFLKKGAHQAVPEYLAQQSKQPEQYLSFMLAVDLQDVFSPVALAKRVGELRSLNSLSTADSADVSRILASAQGVSLILGRKSLSDCILSFEFGQSPAKLEPVAKELFHELSEQNGTSIPELLACTVKMEGNTLKLQGGLKAETLGLLLGIFSAGDHVSDITHSKGDDQVALTKDKVSSSKTKDYFDHVNLYIDSIRRYSAQTTGARAQWNNINARKIDAMSVLGVDPDMIQYGSTVAAMMRNDALAIQQINIKAGQTKASQSLNQGFQYDSYGNVGYYNSYNNVNQHRATDAQARGNAYSNYREMLSAIDQLTADLRKTMTQKYNMDF